MTAPRRPVSRTLAAGSRKSEVDGKEAPRAEVWFGGRRYVVPSFGTVNVHRGTWRRRPPSAPAAAVGATENPFRATTDGMRVGGPVEVALWVSRLLVDEGVTGHVTPLDGGMSIT
ncbi:hypothetical protein [Actinomadura sp. B10D3]|uniref:hypothetical protein n=1 Tax=Actinomadura sp. B10D3 TaxID=3153557 RepID=UPI00325EF911